MPDRVGRPTALGLKLRPDEYRFAADLTSTRMQVALRATGGRGELAAAGIPVWIDIHARIAREKALVIDRRVAIEGS